MMRVLMVCGSFPPLFCGVGEYTAALTGSLEDVGGCEVHVLTSEGGTGSPNVIATSSWRLRDLPRLLRIVRDRKPDLVHFQFPGQDYRGPVPYLLPSLLALAGYRIVITWHEYLDRGRQLFLPNLLLPRAMIVVRPAFREQLKRPIRFLLRKKQIELIPNASTIPAATLSADARADLRAKWGKGRPLVVFFGFAYPHKGVDQLFEIADPAVHHLLIIGKLDPSDEYQRRILEIGQAPPWLGNVTYAGYRSSAEVAALLAAADAVVLPFRSGGGNWNTSIHAAVRQGTFTLTTATDAVGYDEQLNVFYAKPDDLESMRDALRKYAGTRTEPAKGTDSAWTRIAVAHRAVYDAAVMK